MKQHSTEAVTEILERYKSGKLTPEEAGQAVRDCFFTDLGHTVIDNDRKMRNGYPEVVYGEGKSPEQLVDIFSAMDERDDHVIATRVSREGAEAVLARCSRAVYHEEGRILTLTSHTAAPKQSESVIAVVTAGTSDVPVAEEAALTAEFLGNRVLRLIDVGVAGIHRLFDRIEEIRTAKVVIVIAGMEAALPSVVGGLVDVPVIAVPTSVGYGAAFGGLSALLGMLNSCASGVGVVNIDNGFGAAYLASMINRQ